MTIVNIKTRAFNNKSANIKYSKLLFFIWKVLILFTLLFLALTWLIFIGYSPFVFKFIKFICNKLVPTHKEVRLEELKTTFLQLDGQQTIIRRQLVS